MDYKSPGRTFMMLRWTKSSSLAVTVLCLTISPCLGQDSADLAARELAQGRYSEAEALARKYLAGHPRSEEAVKIRARALVGLRQPFEAALTLESFLDQNPAAVEAMKLYGDILSGPASDPAAAQEVLSKVVASRPDDVDAWRHLGRLHLRKGEGEAAARCFARALEVAPDSAALMAGLGTALAAQGRVDQAVQWFDKAARSGAGSPVVLFLIADGYLAAGDHTRAVTWYDKALAASPGLAEGWYQRARAKQGAGDVPGAIKDAEHALSAGASPRETQVLLASLFREAGDLEGARRYTAAVEKITAEQNALVEQRRKIRVALRAAEPLVGQGRCREAIPLYEQVAAELPTFYEAWFALGACYTTERRFGDAERALRRHLEYQTHSADGHAALGVALLAQGRTDDGIAALSRAVELQSDNVDFVLELAAAQRAAGRADSALATLRSGSARLPRNARIEQAHATALLECSDSRSCREELTAAWKTTANSATYWKAVTRLVLADRRKDDTSRGLIRQLVARFPADAEAHLLAAEFFASADDHRAAAAAAARCVELAPASPLAAEALTIQGAAAEASGASEEALSMFASAHQLNSRLETRRPRVSVAYAQALEKLGRESEARAVLDQTLVLAPDEPAARLRRAFLHSAAGNRARATEDALVAVRGAGQDVELERSARALLVRTYLADGREDLAAEHQRWIEAHASANH